LKGIGRLAKESQRQRGSSLGRSLLHFRNKRRKVKISRRDKSVTRDLQQLGSLIKAERQRVGWTVRQLAEAAGLVASTVSRLENGLIAEPRPTHLQRLAQALSIDVEELYIAAGHLTPDALPDLQPYLRAKFGLTEQQASQIEGYLEAVKDTNQPPGKEGQHDRGDKAT
jgi:transcriptional regulator with XRE-family HTH domain